MIRKWSLSSSSFLRFFFAGFIFVIITAYFMLRPSWGFMDDFGNIEKARAFWGGTLSFVDLVFIWAKELGRFQPVYHVWVFFAYWFAAPLVIYLLIFMVGVAVLLLWGRMAERLFPLSEVSVVRYLFPLSFFCFLPFWNIFMYLSVQEKFIFFFGSISFWFLIRAYEVGSLRFLWAVLGFAILAMFGKENGIVFMGVYALIAALDLLVFHHRRKVSRVLFLTSFISSVGYLIFLKSILGGYTQRYQDGLTIFSLSQAALQMPSAIKMVFLLFCFSFVLFLVDFYRGRKEPFLFIALPLSGMGFVLLLLPWGFSNYLLSPLAPFVMSCLYYLGYRFFPALLGRQWMILAVMCALVFVLMGVIVPRISKMADKATVIEAVRRLDRVNAGRFFYPPSFEETAGALRNFTGADVFYTDTVRPEDFSAKSGYLLLNDEAGPIMLCDVKVESSVYRSRTWEILSLGLAPSYRGRISFRLEKNPFYGVKEYLQRLGGGRMSVLK